MAKSWRNKSSTLQLKGFEELYEKFQKAGKDAEKEGRKLFEHAAENLYDSLYEQGKKAGLEEHLLEQLEEELIELPSKNTWHCSVGWKKAKPANPLPDTYKVMFYNYGTPSGDRTTTKGGQRVQIDGKWVTVEDSRGQEASHPNGSHGFIKKAKLAAANKNKKLIKATMEKILGDLE